MATLFYRKDRKCWWMTLMVGGRRVRRSAHPDKKVAEQIKDEVRYDSIFVRDDIALVSAVGLGMRTHYGVAGKMFSALAEAQVNIDSITTSEIRISCAVDKKDAEKALEAVCLAFELDKPTEQRSR